jgi:cytoskeletal protein CcmA (bactofilin family)
MVRIDFTLTRIEEIGWPAGSAQHKGETMAENGTTVIGRGIRIEGSITGTAPIEVQGTLEGTAGTETHFTIRQGGRVKGEIAARSVVVEGSLEGSINAEEKVQLRSTCEVRGNVTALTVAVDEGSFFEGQVKMHRPKKGGRK